MYEKINENFEITLDRFLLKIRLSMYLNKN